MAEPAALNRLVQVRILVPQLLVTQLLVAQLKRTWYAPCSFFSLPRLGMFVGSELNWR